MIEKKGEIKNLSGNNGLKVGLALGSGGAKGLTHIGVLKVLHKHKIYPDYIAGTSMGAVIGAFYAAGYTPEAMIEITKTTDWKNIVDFTIPKSGLLAGERIERRLQNLFKNKKFSDLDIPLKVVSYNLTKKQKVIFSEGNVAKAVRASSSIPGIFAPTIIGKDHYIDGVVADPTPFDVVRGMGADIIIAVDLYKEEKIAKGPIAREGNLFAELRKQFVLVELLNIKNYIFPERWPKFIRKILQWGFDKILYPAKVFRILAGKELPEITKVMYDSVNILSNNLAKERLNCANIDIVVTPVIKKLHWADFDKVNRFVKIGEKAMLEKIPELKKRLKV